MNRFTHHHTHVGIPMYMHRITHSLIHKTGSHIHSHSQSLFIYMDIGTLICTHWHTHYFAQKCSSNSSVTCACSQTDTQETQLYMLRCSKLYSFTHIHHHANNSNMLTCSLTHKYTHCETQTLQQIGTITYTHMLPIPSQKYINTWASSQVNMIRSIHVIIIQVNTFTQKIYFHMQVLYINLLSNMVKFRCHLKMGLLTDPLFTDTNWLTFYVMSFTWTCSHIHKAHLHMLFHTHTYSFMHIH